MIFILAVSDLISSKKNFQLFCLFVCFLLILVAIAIVLSETREYGFSVKQLASENIFWYI